MTATDDLGLRADAIATAWDDLAAGLRQGDPHADERWHAALNRNAAPTPVG